MKTKTIKKILSVLFLTLGVFISTSNLSLSDEIPQGACCYEPTSICIPGFDDIYVFDFYFNPFSDVCWLVEL